MDQYYYNQNGSYTPNNNNNNFSKKIVRAVALGLAFGLVAGVSFQGASILTKRVFGSETEETRTIESTAVMSTDTSAGNSTDEVAALDVSKIVDSSMPSIVAVTNISLTEYRGFFGGRRIQESTSAGSGIIISQDDKYLYIATNNHVVTGAAALTITFVDDESVEATVKGTEASVDLAVVQVRLSDISSETLDAIKIATIGDSDELKVGETSIVIGNSLGYGQTVTTGVISALDRSITVSDDYGQASEISGLLQTDAAVNPGNSGGAIINSKGEVIGIVSAKYSSTQVEGVGYAIPITSAKEIIEDMMN